MASIQSKPGKRGRKTFYVVLSYAGKRKWLKAGTLTDARRLKSQIESLERSQQIEKLGLTTQDVRIDDCFQQYADYIRLHNSPATSKRYLRVLNTFLEFLKMFHPNLKRLSQIRPAHIESYQKQRLQSVELKIAADGDKIGVHKNKRLPLPQTVNFEYSVLRSAFIWAHNHEMISSVPTRKVKKLRVIPTRRGRMLSEEECKRFLLTAKEMANKSKRMGYFYRAFVFLLNTGLRSSELCHLIWDDIDLKIGLISIQAKDGWTPKTYARQFFLNQVCLNLLRDIGEHSMYIFSDQHGRQLDPGQLRLAHIRIAKAAGIENLTRVHDLRHTFNSLMQMNGVDPATMGRILGQYTTTPATPPPAVALPVSTSRVMTMFLAAIVGI